MAGAVAFDSFLMVDWSGGNDRGPRPVADAIWTCLARTSGALDLTVYHRNRQVAESWIRDRIGAEMAAGRRICVGFDFPFATPAGFAAAVTGSDDPFALWDWCEARVTDATSANNRFDLAAGINALFPGTGPFWGNALARDIPGLPRKGSVRSFHWTPARRQVEDRAKGAFACWQLSGAGAMGSQMIMGMPVLSRLRKWLAGQVRVWPFERHDAPVMMMEIWPSLLRDAVRAATGRGDIKDAVQVRVMARTLARLGPDALSRMLTREPDPEGWIFGVDHEAELSDVAFAMIADTGLRQ
jgi:molybdopterin molybdotransferase